jgi:superfamily II DNA helicase RecQ
MTDSGERLSELNRFLSGNKILEVEQRFFQNDKGAAWSFCVRYIQGGNPYQPGTKEKVDYKQVLNESEFAVFSKLREIRKKISTMEAVPAYAVFTDEELAGIARLPEITLAKMQSIHGIGEKKVAKYGNVIIEMMLSKSETIDE